MNNSRHSKLAPSAAHRWAHCTASVDFIESLKLPAEESEYAIVGTLAHETFYVGLGLKNPFQVKYRTPEEANHLPYSFEYVQRLRELYPDGKLHREIRVDPSYYLGTRHCKGTADVVFAVDLGPLYVIDLKFGEHVPVDVVDNLQLILYALGALARFEEKEGYTFTEVVLVISQPRAYHPDGINREWRMHPSELKEYTDWLSRRAREALNPEKAKFRPEPETVCRFCPAQGVCRALAEHNLREAREAFSGKIATEEVTYRSVAQLTPEEMSHLIDEFPAMRRWMTEVSAATLRHLQNGGKVPWYGLKDSLSNRKWAVDEEELEMLFGEEIYERSLISPAQAEKRFGHKVDKLTERVITGQTLARIESSEAAEEPSPFGVIEDA